MGTSLKNTICLAQDDNGHPDERIDIVSSI